MGLDVYLYKYANKNETQKLETQYEKFSEKNWSKHGEYKSLSEETKEQLRKEDENFATSIGLKKGGKDPRKECIQLPSSKYPEHYFKVGYWRSSYNLGGINRVLSNLNLPDLYEIIGRNDDDEYVFAPDWEMSLVRVKEVIKLLREKGNYRCFNFSWNGFKNPRECKITDEQSALSEFTRELERDDKTMDGYSNSAGEFFFNGLKVFAIIHGVNEDIVSKIAGSPVLLPSAYIITEGENEWYIQGLEIVQETIEYVLSQPDKDKFYLHWSS